MSLKNCAMVPQMKTHQSSVL